MAKQLAYGASGPQVRRLQVMLQNKGFNVQADGQLGPETLAAYRAYQSQSKAGPVPLPRQRPGIATPTPPPAPIGPLAAANPAVAVPSQAAALVPPTAATMASPTAASMVPSDTGRSVPPTSASLVPLGTAMPSAAAPALPKPSRVFHDPPLPSMPPLMDVPLPPPRFADWNFPTPSKTDFAVETAPVTSESDPGVTNALMVRLHAAAAKKRYGLSLTGMQ